jgi:hypothetical protein
MPTGLCTVKLDLLRHAGATVNTLPYSRGDPNRQLAVMDAQAAWFGPRSQTVDPGERGPHLCIQGPVVQQLLQLLGQPLAASNAGGRLAHAQNLPPRGSTDGLRMGLSPCAWRAGTGRPLASLLIRAIESARWLFFIAMAQRVPPQAVVDALVCASRRGVGVSVLLHHSSGQVWRWRQCCDELLRARAWVYHDDNRQAFSPHCTVDGMWSCIGLGGAHGGDSPCLVVQGEAFAETIGAACQATVERATLLDARTLPGDRLVHQLMRAASGAGALFGARPE